jgi:hypothetical protein
MPSPKTNPTRLLLTLSLFCAITAVVLILWWPRQTEPGRQAPEKPAAGSSQASPVQGSANTVASSADDGASKLREVREAISKQTDAQMNREQLTELRRRLEAMPKGAAVAEIRRFLDSKSDASTHLGFKLASNGMLDDAPTLRTFLLDELGRIDPAAAAEYAKTVLASADSADEWAVALRSLALGDSSADGRALLTQKINELLQNTAWRQNPSAGYLEAFDVTVFLGGTNFLPALSALVRSGDNATVSHAAYLAMDRLVINNPATVLTSLAASPDMMQGRESTRADYFARADARDPQQRQVLESYLLNPAISDAELQTFAGIYPNANFMISPNLLTQSTTPDRNALQSRDAQSLAIAQQWLTDPRFTRAAPELQTVIQRLEGFAAQAKH